MAETKFLIKGPEDNRNSVELWSNVRLPFEPKGWMLDMRDSIRSALIRMRKAEKSMLYAVYVSKHQEFCDLENVLLYNVGSGSIKHLSTEGLCIERLISSPRQLSKFPHYHRYSQIALDKRPSKWVRKQNLVRWRGIPCAPLQGELKPHSIWHAIKKNEIDVDGKVQPTDKLGVEIKINAPREPRVNLAMVIKPLLDGIISALHYHNGSDNSIVVPRLARLLAQPQSIIENMLMDPTKSVLGERKLLHPHGKGVQWNPADDGCVAITILLNSANKGSDWSLDGDLFSVKSAVENSDKISGIV